MVRPDLLENLRPIEPNHGSYLLAVGALVPEKNLTLFLDAVGKLRSRVKVVIAGQGPERENLLSLAKKYGIDLSITYANDGERLAQLYSDCLLLVQPSLYECLSMVPIEAGLFSKPSIIVNSMYSGNREVVLDGVTGCALEDTDVSRLAEKIEYLLDHPEERIRLGSNANKVVSELFMPDVRVSELVEALKFE